MACVNSIFTSGAGSTHSAQLIGTAAADLESEPSASAAIDSRAIIESIKVTNSHTATGVVTLYDGTSTGDSVFDRIYVAANSNVDLDYHGAIVARGLFLSANASWGDGTLTVTVQHH